MLTASLKHIDLKEVAARLEPSRQKPSARGRVYTRTEPGEADFAFIGAVLALKNLWAASTRELRMAEIEAHRDVQACKDGDIRLAASLKRLARIKQVKLDFDREGVIVSPGSSWIET